MTKLGRFRAGVVAIIVLAISASAWGQQMVTFWVDGQTTSVYDPCYLLADLVHDSDWFQISYRYDLAAQDLNPADPHRGEYRSPNALLDMSIGRLPISIPGAGTKVIVIDDGPTQMDGLAITATSAFVVGQMEILDVLLYAKDFTGSVLVSDALPERPLRSFREWNWLVQGRQGGNYFGIEGTWTVPEPLTLALFLPTLLLVRKRRR